MTYILIIIFWGGNSTRSIATAEFNTMEQCQYVASAVPQKQKEWAGCFEKGIKR